MQKRTIDPWVWGKQTNSAQAVEVKNVEGTLYCSGQVAIDENGVPSNADMRSQLIQTIQNLETLIIRKFFAGFIITLLSMTCL